MTVSTELSHEEYTGNGVTTDFDFRFRIFEAKHLVVSVADSDGTERVLTNGTDYTLRGVGSYRGGKVILKMPLATGWKIGIARDLPAVQETDLRNQGKFFAEVHEDAFDYLTMLIQKSLGYLSLCLRKPSFISDHYDAKGNKISNLGKPVKDDDAVDLGTMKEHISAKDKRSLRVADKDIPALPNAANRANKLLSFNKDGEPVVIVPESGSAADVLAELGSPDFGRGDSLIAVRQPFSGAVVRTQHDKNSDIVSSADVGVSSDDSTTQFTNLDSEGVSVLITSDEISVADDIPGTVHLSLKEVTQSGSGAVPIRNLSRKNILPKINTAYDVSDDSYYLKTPDKNLLANGAFTSWPSGFLSSIASAGQGYITTGWRLESAGGGPTAANIRQLSLWGGLSFSMTNTGSTTDYGYMYIRQYINGVQQFSGATLTTCIDIEVDQPVYLQAYVRMRINASNAVVDRPIVADSNFIALDSSRKRIALTMVCPDVESFRGTETDLNGLEFAWRIVDQRLGGTETTNVKVRGISLVPGDEIPSALSPQLYEDIVEANVMIEHGTYCIAGLSSTAGQRRFWVPFRATKYRTPTVTLTDVAGTPGKVSTYDASGTRTDGVTPTYITADSTGFEVLLVSSSAAGIKFTYLANSYW